MLSEFEIGRQVGKLGEVIFVYDVNDVIHSPAVSE
jgi:hypothetical protein